MSPLAPIVAILALSYPRFFNMVRISAVLQYGKALDEIVPSISLGAHCARNTASFGIVLVLFSHGRDGERGSGGGKDTKSG